MRYRSRFLGSFGGNMDYIGALLFVGDGQAAKGAGELTGDALETSMHIEFTVDVQARGIAGALMKRSAAPPPTWFNGWKRTTASTRQKSPRC